MERQWTKAITFSFDDGITQDRRLIKLLNKYGLKATFNLNGALWGTGKGRVWEGITVPHIHPEAAEVPAIYAGHEVAGHSLHHPHLDTLTDAEIAAEVEEDRLALSELVGYEVVGFAYPFGNRVDPDRVRNAIAAGSKVQYGRATGSTGGFITPPDLLSFTPTSHFHEWDRNYALADRLFSSELDPSPDRPAVFYIWGHAYEFDLWDEWEAMEDFCRYISGKPDVFYGTNKEVLLK